MYLRGINQAGFKVDSKDLVTYRDYTQLNSTELSWVSVNLDMWPVFQT